MVGRIATVEAEHEAIPGHLLDRRASLGQQIILRLVPVERKLQACSSLPSASQSSVKFDICSEFVQIGLGQRELSCEISRVAIEYLQVTRSPALVSHVRQLCRFFGRVCQLFLLDAEFLDFAVSNQRVGNISKRVLHSTLVKQRRFFSAGSGEPDLISDPATFKHRLDCIAAKCPKPSRTRKQTSQSGALITARGRQ